MTTRLGSIIGMALLLTAGTANAQQAFLDQYCAACHNERLRTADLMLDRLDLEQVGDEAATWETVVRKLRTGMMPPSGARRPDRPAIDQFTSNLEDALDLAAATSPDPGAPALHRLNRTEYANAVRDLLALPIDAETMLPGDDSSEGFDNIANVLSVSPALMQAYVSAAARISRLAVGDPTMASSITTYVAQRGLSQTDHFEGLGLGTRGGMLVEHVFPLDAEYEIGVRRAGAGFGLPAIGGDEAVEITLNGDRARMVESDARGAIRLQIPAGPQTLGVALVKTRSAHGVDDLFSELAASVGVQGVSITGPLDATGPGDTPSRRRIFTCNPTSLALDAAASFVETSPTSLAPEGDRTSHSNQEIACARAILRRLASRAFRRPVADEDVDTLMGFYEDGYELRGFEAGIQYALARVLVDPRFVFRFESEPEDAPEGTVYQIGDLELASRLSFFLWSSIPDDELREAAAAGRLSDPDELERQTRRMLADPRADALVDNFAGQWLLLRQLETVNPGTREFDGNLRRSFQRETEMLFEAVMREDRSIVDLLDADFTFVDERLARHYGMPNIRGSRFRRVAIQDEARRGLLGHGSVLTVTSAGNRTSPVRRGKWVLENLLGATVPLPPPDVDTTLEGDDGSSTVAQSTSLRQRLERHRANPSCASCHSIMDPVGFALENFDLIGQWRDADGGTPVNASGRLVDGTELDGPASLRRAFLDRRDAFVSTATEKLLTYALGRRTQHFDMPAVRSITRDSVADDYRFSSLVVGIVKSVPFRMRRKTASSNEQ